MIPTISRTIPIRTISTTVPPRSVAQLTQHFCTATKVYPPYLPYLHSSMRMGRRWFAPALALTTLALSVPILRHIQNRPAQQGQLEASRQREGDGEKLMEAYGARDGLDDLVRAVEVYEGRKTS